MGKVALEIPVETGLSARQLKEFCCAKLYEQGLISSGTGAIMLQVSRREFIELLAKYNVPYINYPVSELKNELKLLDE